MFNITSDPYEHIDMAKDPAHAELLQDMLDKFDTIVTKTVWQHTAVENSNNSKAVAAARGYGGYWGPYEE